MGTLGGLISHSAVWTGTHALGQTDRSYADGFVGLSVGVLLGRFGNKLKLGLIQLSLSTRLSQPMQNQLQRNGSLRYGWGHAMKNYF